MPTELPIKKSIKESLFKKIVHKIINDIRRNVEKPSQQKPVTMNNKADEECDIMVEDIILLNNSSNESDDKITSLTDQINRIVTKNNIKDQADDMQNLDTQDDNTNYMETITYKTASIKHQPKDFVNVVPIKLERFWEIHDNKLYKGL